MDFSQSLRTPNGALGEDDFGGGEGSGRVFRKWRGAAAETISNTPRSTTNNALRATSFQASVVI